MVEDSCAEAVGKGVLVYRLPGGSHRYLGMIMTTAAYTVEVSMDTTELAQPFTVPTCPGTCGIITRTTGAACAKQLQQFNANMYNWWEYGNSLNTNNIAPRISIMAY
jgi:hypothetical protein